jgi:hypothetical protein
MVVSRRGKGILQKFAPLEFPGLELTLAEMGLADE